MCENCVAAFQDMASRLFQPEEKKEISVLEAVKSWEKARGHFENWMMEIGLSDFSIDEIAILFPTRQQMGEAVFTWVQEGGVELFNTAIDRVMTTPFNTEYEVEYAFMRMPSDMRIEAMALRTGFSPLHQALLEAHRAPIAVHFSFKCQDPSEYEHVLDTMRGSGRASQVQGCDSAYGRFSYWNVPELVDNVASIYLKPRVNLRDRGEFGMPIMGTSASKIVDSEVTERLWPPRDMSQPEKHHPDQA